MFFVLGRGAQLTPESGWVQAEEARSMAVGPNLMGFGMVTILESILQA